MGFLNSHIRGYDFGSDDRPSLFDPSSLDVADKKFRQSAAQSISLARHLPLLVADKVPEKDEYWHSLLVLLKICQICLSPTYVKKRPSHIYVF